MNEAQFQALVTLVRNKAEKMAAVDASEGEPWHVTLTALTGGYTDISREELVWSIQSLAFEHHQHTTMLYKYLGVGQAMSDAIQYAVIAVVMETALAVAHPGKVLALPEGEVA